MDETKPWAKLTPKTMLLTIVGLVGFFLYILLYNVDIPEIISTVQRADLRIFSVALVVSIGEVFFHAVSWRAILSSLNVKISVIHAFLYTWYSMFIDMMIPAESISGELCRVYLVNREQNGTSGKTVASVVMQRIISMGINVVMLILAVAFLFNTTQLTPLIFNLILLFTATVTLFMGLLLLVSWMEKWSTKIINGLVRVGEFLSRGRWKQKLAKIKKETLNAAKMFHDSMKELGRNPARLIVPTLLFVLNWSSSLAVSYLVFLSLGLHVSWAVILITSSIVVAVKSIPVGVPFEAGLPEITMTTFYTWMGVPAEISATATILIRILTLWLRLGIGFASQQWIK
ncbi:MAG: lysylphosphatidylglycerol synthase transmembrane domain-containing protein [Candidatus Bathyarchaeota archaeon]